MKLYSYNKCGTCRKAKKFLDDPDRLKAIAQKFKQKVNKEDIQTLETL